MKIAYVAFENFSVESGVLKKIIKQIQTWSNNSNDVKLFVVSAHKNLWEGLRDIHVEVVPPKEKAILLERLNEWNPDIVYVRAFFSVRHLWQIVKKFHTVFEINSDDLIEFKMFKKPNWYRLFKYKYGRKVIFKRSSGLIFVTKELSETHYGRGPPYRVISNGIILSDYPILKAPENTNPHLAFIGTKGFPWHGVEKIILLSDYFPNWHFDIIGYSKRDLDKKLPDNVHLHGRIGQEEYLPILERADVAIGTFSLYEKKMNEACPLKVREYLAYGIPTIIGYNDTDFPKGAPFILQLPNNSTNVEENLKIIEKFVISWMGRRVERKDILHIDMASKERKRIKFFNMILKN